MKKSEYIEKSNAYKYAISQLKAEKAVRRKNIDKVHLSRVTEERTQYENEVAALDADIRERKYQLQTALNALEVAWAKEEERNNNNNKNQ